ncbi:MAG: hypothetical protein QXF25_00875 [Candidatus Pacearchaeota archaeon]
MGLWSSFLKKISFEGIESLDVFLINFIFAAILLFIGILLGRFVTRILRKSVERSRIEETIKKSFIELFITVIRWSIYIIFVNLALTQLDIPQLTGWLVSVLLVIPALTGALLIAGVGFVIAQYLKEIIEESKISGYEILSKIFFYFVIYIFLIFAIKTALIGQDKNVVNIIILIFTGVVATAVAYSEVRSKKK